MKKLTGLFAIFGLILFVCVGMTQLSNAQKFKPGVKDIKKPGISKSVIKKPGLSSSIKSQLPALEVSRLTLDSGCKITGFLQNKGSKMDARHPDFSKLQIKVGYTFDGKTKEVLLETRSGGSASQPRLLKGATDLRNFTQGKPAKFTSKLKVPATGKGFAIVYAEVDPNNRIRETRAGEQKKRIQARLRSRCAPRGPDSKKVNPPKRIKESVNSPTSRIVKPPSGVKPGRSSKKLGKSSIKIDPDIKKKANVSPNSKFNSENMVTKSLTIAEDFVSGGSGKGRGSFSILTPLPGSRVNRDNPPAILWKVPIQFLNSDGHLNVRFGVFLQNGATPIDLDGILEVEVNDHVELDGELEVEQRSVTSSPLWILMPYSYNSQSKMCRITSWEIESSIEDDDYYLTVVAVRVNETGVTAVGRAVMQEPFEIYTVGGTGSDSEPEPEEILDPISDNNFSAENVTETVHGMLNPSVTVISPNGNEEWGLNTGHEIVWKTFARDPERNFRVTLEKHTERGVSDVRSISGDRSLDYDRSTGTYKLLWFVDSDIDPADFYRIRVSETGGTLEDESNEYFSIKQEKPGDQRFLVNVTYPVDSGSGGSSVDYRKIKVRWIGNYDVCKQRNLNIVLHSVTNGRQYSLPFDPNRAHVTDGTVEFDLPRDISQGDECYISVNTVPLGCSGSSERFTIQGSMRLRDFLGVSNPIASARYYLGNRVKIIWKDGWARDRTHTDPTPLNREIVLLETDSSRVIQTIPVADMRLNEDRSRFYTFWDIPLSLPDEPSGYRIKIRALDTGEEVLSQGFFIMSGGIDLTSPRGGGTYYTRSTIPIQWTSAEGSEGELKIVLAPHDASSINDSDGVIISSDIDARAGRQFYNWLIPVNTEPGEYKIFVGYDLNRFPGVDAVYESGVFTISKPSLKFTGPDWDSVSGTPRLLADNNITINWAYEGDVDPSGRQEVTISLIFTDLSEKRIATLPVANRSYTWQIGRTIANMHDVATSRGGRTPDPHTGNFFQLHIYLNGDDSVEDVTRHFIIVPDGE